MSTKLLTIDIVISILKKNCIALMKYFIRISFQIRKNFILDRYNISGFNNINHAIVIHTPIYVSSPNNNRDIIRS